ncbi:MAG TPA: biotin--[acetyl-CoA-carboxylase] ligase [Bacteroidales bacterium]|nr:biotin--[acetyl-CoA-carboxylase] ligase [Bacteroidales bacterium]
MREINLGFPLIKLNSVDSTNNYASRLLRQEAVAEGTVILAVHQTRGKGQGGTSWESEEDRNLLLSLILRPEFIPAGKQFYLSMSIANGIVEFIASHVDGARIKWPNDIYIEGKKVSGILIENTIMSQNLHTSIVGIGLNVNQREFSSDLPNPTSLNLATGREYDLDETLMLLLKHLQVNIGRFYREAYGEIKTTYLNNLWLINKWALFTDDSGEFEGRIADVAETGELVVTKRDGRTVHYDFKEITFHI